MSVQCFIWRLCPVDQNLGTMSSREICRGKKFSARGIFLSSLFFCSQISWITNFIVLFILLTLLFTPLDGVVIVYFLFLRFPEKLTYLIKLINLNKKSGKKNDFTSYFQAFLLAMLQVDRYLTME